MPSSRSAEAGLRHNIITNMLPNTTERGNSEELIKIHGKLRARKKLSLVKTERLEGDYQNPILSDSPAACPTAGEGNAQKPKNLLL